ncbi:hypothetical protein CDL15_Pgr019910 [Punica granatum]|uniref:Uncharacterized protein n=1 Tax=Punica granatum TaxID=22663 RepID=A0A218VQK0_PUNGR|nr:hypothetical protein CDL15_Pgr019910 [Punica granatum]
MGMGTCQGAPADVLEIRATIEYAYVLDVLDYAQSSIYFNCGLEGLYISDPQKPWKWTHRLHIVVRIPRDRNTPAYQSSPRKGT